MFWLVSFLFVPWMFLGGVMHHSRITDTPTLILVILIKSCLHADTAVFTLQPKKLLGRCILNYTSSVIKVLFQKKNKWEVVLQWKGGENISRRLKMILCLGREVNAVKRVKCLQIVLLFCCGQGKTLGKTKSVSFSMVHFFSNLLVQVLLGNSNIPGWVFGLIFVGLSVCEIPGCFQG